MGRANVSKLNELLVDALAASPLMDLKTFAASATL